MPDTPCDDGRPAEEQSDRPEGLTRPSPHRETIHVISDEAVTEPVRSSDSVLHISPGWSEGVAGYPEGPSPAVSDLDIGNRSLDARTLRGQHAPHPAHSIALKLPESRVDETRIWCVTRCHAIPIAVVQTCVEAVDEPFKGVLHTHSVCQFVRVRADAPRR